MKKIIYVCAVLFLLLTGCSDSKEQVGQQEEKKTGLCTSSERNSEQITSTEKNELIKYIKGFINSKHFKKAEKDDKKIKLEELLSGYVNSGLILDYELSINKERPCFSVTFLDGSEDIFLLEDFPKNQN